MKLLDVKKLPTSASFETARRRAVLKGTAGGTLLLAALALSGCAQDPQIIRETVPVVSSKPYRYLKPSPKDALTKGTLDQISRHNATHWKVKEAEKKAEAN
jgi:hypothetical protein